MLGNWWSNVCVGIGACALQVMQDELQRLGFKVNHHEENIRFLKSEINAIEELSVDLGSKMLMPCATSAIWILGHAVLA